MTAQATIALAPALALLLPFVIGYLLGSIPTGYLIARLVYGMDIRQHGSGNIGFTNVFRVLGFTPGVLVLVADILKGWVAVRVALLVVAPGADELLVDSIPVLAGLAAILGHTYSVFLRFQGGKGVATAAGVLIALMPEVALIVTGIWLVVLAVSRYVSAASVIAAAAFPVAVLALNKPLPMLVLSILVAVLVIVRHKSNIVRLMRREESKFELPSGKDGSGSHQHKEGAS